MRLRIAFFRVFFGLGLLGLGPFAAGPIRAVAQVDDPYVALVNIDGGIDRFSARLLSRGIRQAERQFPILVF